VLATSLYRFRPVVGGKREGQREGKREEKERAGQERERERGMGKYKHTRASAREKLRKREREIYLLALFPLLQALDVHLHANKSSTL
jgi:hypothetical protein